MPRKLECRSFVCRIVKVCFPAGEADNGPQMQSVAPTAAEADRNSRRESVSRVANDRGQVVFIVAAFLGSLGTRHQASGR